MHSKLCNFIHLLQVIVVTCLALTPEPVPSPVKPPPPTTCNSPYGQGVCTTQDDCNTGYTVKGDCPTTLAGNLCCIQATDAVAPEEFIAYIKHIYDLAVAYPDKGSKSPNQLVMEWGRHVDYGDFQGWCIVAGCVDQDFIDYVRNAGVMMLQTIRDPFYEIDTGISHTLAAMNVAYLEGSPSGASVNKADVAGWGGDWWQFYVNWRNDKDKNASWANGSNYCADELATANSPGFFKLTDMIEDADGYDIGMALRKDPTLSITDQFHDLLLGGGYKTRMTRFYNGRFGGTPKSASAVAKYVLSFTVSSPEELVISGLRFGVITKAIAELVIAKAITHLPVELPWNLLDAELQPFCDGFGNTMADLVKKEATKY